MVITDPSHLVSDETVVYDSPAVTPTSDTTNEATQFPLSSSAKTSHDDTLNRVQETKDGTSPFNDSREPTPEPESFPLQLLDAGVNGEDSVSDDNQGQIPKYTASDIIVHEPYPNEPMTLTPKQSVSSASSSSSSSTVQSGYHREQSELQEFFTELFLCFGVLDNRFPHDGAGCITMWATFCGNTIFSCCKVK